MSQVSLKEIHKKLLEIVIDFDEFCKENEIEYYLMGGSALGAVRHKGFIPWDDDVDVFMTYKNYQKFLHVCKTRLDTNKFYFQKEDTEEWPLFFSKIRVNKTTYIEKDFVKNKEMHQGFFIDIMCLYSAYDSTFLRYIQYISANLLRANALAKLGYVRNDKKKMIVIHISKLIVRGKFKMLLKRVMIGNNNENSNLVGHFCGRAKFRNTSFFRKYLGKPRYVKFENIMLPVPENAESYLQLRYGENFMEMPDEKTKAMYPSHAHIVSTTEHYTKFLT